MIKLQRPDKPMQLTNERVAELTAEFKLSEKSVWKQSYITKSLLEMSFGKCCFCETNINEESKYMEVEHFYPKSLYPDEVVQWDNLLPICKRCNIAKSNHDTKLEPIINPVIDNPKDHLKIKDYRIYRLSELGKLTIDVITLNESQRLVKKRFEIGEEIHNKLENLVELTRDYIKDPMTRRKNKLTNTLSNLMLEGTKGFEYSATAATVILEDMNYQEIKQLFCDNKLWENEFIELEKQMQYCALI